VQELEEADDELEEEDDRPKKKKGAKGRKKGGQKAGLWIGLAVALLLLVLGGGSAAVYFIVKGALGGKGAGADDLIWVPADAQVFVTARIGDLWKSKVAQDILQKVNQAGGANPVKEMEDAMGITPEDITRGTMVVQDTKTETFWAIMSTSKPFDRKKLEDKLKLNGTEHKHQNRAYFLKTDGTAAIHFPSDKQLVLASSENAMKACLDHYAQPRTAGPLKNALALAKGSHQGVVGFQIPAWWSASRSRPRWPSRASKWSRHPRWHRLPPSSTCKAAR
jgi:hypothetical protein